MTEPPSPLTPPAPGGEQPGWYAVPDPAQNWGLAAGGYPHASYAVPVQRPPRPAVVSLALALTYLGVAISGAFVIANAIHNWLDREKLVGAMSRDAPPDAPQIGTIFSTTITASIIANVVVWVLAAAGVIVCAVLSRRGHNAARIVLASLVGVFALNNLCGGAAGVFVRSSSVGSTSPFGPTAMLPWWAAPTQFLLAVLAVAIVVLLLVPPANRYFSPGRGRRFVS